VRFAFDDQQNLMTGAANPKHFVRCDGLNGRVDRRTAMRARGRDDHFADRWLPVLEAERTQPYQTPYSSTQFREIGLFLVV